MRSDSSESCCSSSSKSRNQGDRSPGTGVHLLALPLFFLLVLPQACELQAFTFYQKVLPSLTLVSVHCLEVVF
jgi:hypothetical protein